MSKFKFKYWDDIVINKDSFYSNLEGSVIGYEELTDGTIKYKVRIRWIGTEISCLETEIMPYVEPENVKKLNVTCKFLELFK